MAPVSAHFRHVLIAKALNQTELEEGRVTLAPGGRMRWEYTRPAGKLAIADGKTTTLFLPEGREVFIQKLAEGPGEPLLFRLLSGRVNLEQEMACDGVTIRGGEAVLSLRLLGSGADVQEVEVTTVTSTGQVLQVRYHDALGNEVSLSLKEVHPLSAVPDDLFTFKLPEGARVFRGD
jgi:outer membrane lipoprotein-sorting protein